MEPLLGAGSSDENFVSIQGNFMPYEVDPLAPAILQMTGPGEEKQLDQWYPQS